MAYKDLQDFIKELEKIEKADLSEFSEEVDIARDFISFYQKKILIVG